MPNFGVGIAILAGDKVLLTRREDFEVWCLPGGSVEDGESLAQTAQREAREETGLEVRIERLVGIYSKPKWTHGGSHEIIFAASPAGGALSPDPREVIETGWFGLNDLPAPILPWAVQEIRDALSGVGGSAVWRQELGWSLPPDLSRQDLYRLRDESGLSRQGFFLKHADQETFWEVSEVPPKADADR
jgi:8-oxo-dGTP diphosphatase